MELSPSNSIFNQSGIYQLHPTRQGEAQGLYRFSRGTNNSTLLGGMIYALRTHYLQQQPWKAKIIISELQEQDPRCSKQAQPGAAVLGLVLAPLKVCGAGK